MTLCSPWIDTDAITLCSLDVDRDATVEPEDLNIADKAVLIASNWLYKATAQRYPGICTDHIWPTGRSPVGWGQGLDYPANIGGSRILADTTLCACTYTSLVVDGIVYPALELPNRPVVDVIEVTIAGAPFVDFQVIDDRYLIRLDRREWPLQNLSDPTAFSIEYRWGSAPPPHLIHAVEVLACELMAGWCIGDNCPECRLPKRLVTATYEGATMAVLDPFDFLDSGRFGILEVDGAIAMENPNRLQRNGKVVTAQDVLREPHRVRPA